MTPSLAPLVAVARNGTLPGDMAPFDWTAVLWQARRQRYLLPLAIAALDQDRVPGAWRAQLRQVRTTAAMTRLARTGELIAVQRAFNDAQVPVLVLNDVTYCAAGHDDRDRRADAEHTTYLARESHIADATRVLIGCGYTLDQQTADRVLDATHTVPYLRTAPDGWWQRAVNVSIGSCEVRTLSPLDWCAHQAIVAGRTLRHLNLRAARDLARLATQLTDDELVCAVEQCEGRERRALYALAASCHLIGLPQPAPVLNRLGAAGVSRAAAWVERRLPSPGRGRERDTSARATLGVFVPSPDAVIDRMLALTGITAGESWLDLGCGDGRIVIAAAQRGIRAVGIDCDPVRLSEARNAAAVAGVADRVAFVQGDVFTAALPPADVVSLHITPAALRPVFERLRAALPSGARVVTLNGDLPAGPPARSEMVVMDHFRTATVSVWVMP